MGCWGHPETHVRVLGATPGAQGACCRPQPRGWTVPAPTLASLQHSRSHLAPWAHRTPKALCQALHTHMQHPLTFSQPAHMGMTPQGALRPPCSITRATHSLRTAAAAAAAPGPAPISDTAGSPQPDSDQPSKVLTLEAVPLDGKALLIASWDGDDGDGGDGGYVSGGDDGHGDEGPHHPGVSLNPFYLLVLAYTAFLLWIASCAIGLEQYLDGHIHRLPGADKWDVSIIIPALNEEKGLGETLRWLRENLEGGKDLEIIVVDGGSDDKTVRVAWDNGASRVVRSSRRGRAAQMNAGAAHASGEVLCFLHADTLPPVELVSVLRTQLADPRSVLLAFKTTIQATDGEPLRLMTAHHQLKTWFYPLLLRPMEYLTGLRLVFGDQVMCCRKTDFQAVGGFNATLPIMEDADLCRRMYACGPAPQHVRARHTKLAFKGRMHGRIREVADHMAITSGRRLEVWGNVQGTYIHFRIALAWLFGASGEELSKLYHRMYTDSFR